MKRNIIIGALLILLVIVVGIVLAVLGEIMALLDRLRKGEIDPKNVDIKKWNETLEALQDLTRK